MEMVEGPTLNPHSYCRLLCAPTNSNSKPPTPYHPPIYTEDGHTFRARSVVLAMGAWTNRVPGLESLPLEITEESVGYFKPKAGASEAVDHTYRSMPVFLHRAPNGIEGRCDQGFYGLPQVEIGVKVAAHHVGPVIDPERLAAREAGGDLDAASKQARDKVRWVPHVVWPSVW